MVDRQTALSVSSAGGSDERAFDIAICQAASVEEAPALMCRDPAVAPGGYACRTPPFSGDTCTWPVILGTIVSVVCPAVSVICPAAAVVGPLLEEGRTMNTDSIDSLQNKVRSL